MDMKPDVGEPAAGPWQAEPLESLVQRLLPAAGQRLKRPWIVAVDGRSGSGKTTLVDRLLARVPESDVVHTDDVAWHLSFFDWADELRDGVLEPLLRGEAVHYRPPGWVARERPGAIALAPGGPWCGWKGADHHAKRSLTWSTLRSGCSATTLKPDVDSWHGMARKKKTCTGSGKNRKYPSYLKTGHGSVLQRLWPAGRPWRTIRTPT